MEGEVTDCKKVMKDCLSKKVHFCNLLNEEDKPFERSRFLDFVATNFVKDLNYSKKIFGQASMLLQLTHFTFLSLPHAIA